MNLQYIQLGFNVLIFVTSATAWIYAWNVNRNRISEQEIEEFKAHTTQELTDLKLKYTELKGRVDALPTQNSMSRLSNQVSEIDGDMKRLGAQFQGLDQKFEIFAGSVKRIEEWLLDSKK